VTPITTLSNSSVDVKVGVGVGVGVGIPLLMGLLVGGFLLRKRYKSNQKVNIDEIETGEYVKPELDATGQPVMVKPSGELPGTTHQPFYEVAELNDIERAELPANYE
jgi:hypothetical protein